ECGNLLPLWSWATPRRATPLLCAECCNKFANPTNGGDRSPKTKALTGQRTPKRSRWGCNSILEVTLMTTSRRDFIKTAGVVAGAVALPSALPAWLSEVEAVEAATTAAVDKNALADIALSVARGLGVTYADIRITRYRNEQMSTSEKQV